MSRQQIFKGLFALSLSTLIGLSIWLITVNTSSDDVTFLGQKVSIYPYPDYNGDIHVSGDFWVDRQDVGNVIRYSLKGLEQDSVGGWHVHSGGSCENSGSHYVDRVVTDPWINTKWVSNNKGNSFDTVDMSDIPQDLAGRTVVLHSSDGIRIGCGEIPGEQSLTQTPTPAPTIRGTPPSDSCQDDYERISYYTGFNCSSAASYLGICSISLNEISPFGSFSKRVMDFCPLSCNNCLHEDNCEDNTHGLVKDLNFCRTLSEFTNFVDSFDCDFQVNRIPFFYNAPNGLKLSDICPHSCQQCGCRDNLNGLVEEFGGCSEILKRPSFTCDTRVTPDNTLSEKGELRRLESNFKDYMYTLLDDNTRDLTETYQYGLNNTEGLLSNSLFDTLHYLPPANNPFPEDPDDQSVNHRRPDRPSNKLNMICRRTCDTCNSENCFDDDLGLAVALGRCSGALTIPTITCDSRLSEVSQIANPNYVVSDYCTDRCGKCDEYPTSQPTRFPTAYPTRSRRRRRRRRRRS